MGITIRTPDFKHALLHLQDGDIECATSQVVDCDDGRSSLVESVGEGSSCRLVDDAQDFKACNRAGKLGC
jgi:hypothetical protein